MVDTKQKLKEQKFPFIIITSAVLLTILMSIFVVRPLYKGIRKNSVELKEKKSVLLALETKLENLKKLKEKEAELKEKNEKVLASLPADKDVARLFIQFENIARESGLNISKVAETNLATTGTTTTNNNNSILNKVTYNVTGNAGSYGSFKDAVTRLSTALRLLNITEISLTDNSGKLEAVLSVDAYSRGEAK